MQLDLFSPIPHGIPRVHLKENNQESQEHLDKHRIHFSKQCVKVYELLKSGLRLTVLGAANEHGIMYLPRRIKDLRDIYKVDIKDRFIPGTRFKEYWMEKI